MSAGISLFLFAIGAILAFAVDYQAQGIDIAAVGWILMGVGVFGILMYLMFLASRGNQDGTTPNSQDTLLPTAVPGVDEPTEFYRAVGDYIVFYDGGIGTQLSEGDYVENLAGTASGVVVSGGTVIGSPPA